MLVLLEPDVSLEDPRLAKTLSYLKGLPKVEVVPHSIQGESQKLTELYLIGNTRELDQDAIKALPLVDRVVRISQPYKILGRHNDQERHTGFHYNGVAFNQDNLQIFAGLCAVDSRESVEAMMKAVAARGLTCTRMGAYKPRTNPYSFQGYGKDCLPYVFELAGQYGIKVIAMEVTHESHIEEIDETLEKLGRPTGVMLQIGTRNTQNFELLKAIGRQKTYPALLKRGYGISLDESLNAAEYLASEGNSKVIFCLRGVKSDQGAPHRNLVDFAHVPVVKRLTRMPVCIDPSHSVGSRASSPDGLLDLLHVSAQGIIAGANMVLVDFHPNPNQALVDGPQALLLNELNLFLEDVKNARAAYEKRVELFKTWQTPD